VKSEIFYNKKSIDKNLDIKISPYLVNVEKDMIVDINNLLNRVKVDQYDEKKKKFIFFGYGILLMVSMGIFISIIK
tara:strand:- start:452 stop:679 length:228 start_codon:yes stop_codon:yes gene_type:complete